MDFIPSLIIYNPLEAMVIIIAANYIANTKLSFMNIIRHSYILGLINLTYQIAVEYLFGTALYPIFSLISNIIIFPVVNLLYYKFMINKRIDVMKFIFIIILYFVSTLFILQILNITGILSNVPNKYDFIEEIILNATIKTIQFCAVGFVYLKMWVKMNEKDFKEDCI